MTTSPNAQRPRCHRQPEQRHTPARSGRLLPKPLLAVAAACAFASLLAADPAFAHGFVGKRFFPATLTNDDPFVADELSAPTVSSRKMPPSGDEPATVESAVSVDFSKRLTPNFAVGVDATYLFLNPDRQDSTNGFDNFALSFKYQFYKNDARESVASFALDWDIGGSGAERVGAESFSTVTPTLLFGKGFGGASAKYLRPFAVTTELGLAYPTKQSSTVTNAAGQTEIEQNPDVLNWGFSVEYSLPYLQAFVKDVGLKKPFNRLIPLVEFSFQTPLNRNGGGTTGTINPGVIWAGQKIQLGIEAVVPVNEASGKTVGVIAQLHFYLDDIWGAR